MSDDLQIGFDSSGLVTGVRAGEAAMESFIGEVQKLDKTLDKLGASSKTSLGRMAKAMKDIDGSDRSIASAFKAANKSLITEMSGGEEQILKLVRSQNIAIQQQYERRLAKMGQLSSQELQTWKDYGVALGGLQARQLRLYKVSLKEEAAARAESIAEQKAYLSSVSQLVKAEEALRIESMRRRATSQVNAAMQTAGTYQAYNPTTGVAGAVKNIPKPLPVPTVSPKDTDNLDKLASSFRRVNDSANDLHSGIRGLASGFGALWLTWGNLGPLFIGAAISNSFVQAAKTGMEVAQSMAIIANLGGNTAEEMGRLTAELDRLGKSGPFGPVEVANAMKTLSLAGLKANEILAVTSDVLNFSIAGTTNLETAAKTLMTVSTAFGMGAEGFGRVSDVISKAAAESLTSVESFSEAMKTASVINTQYGVSLEDTATALASMSQIGIEGSAAGTALRNMYADLSGRSKEVAKILKSQNIEMRDAVTGGFRPMIEVVSELKDKMSAMTATGQKNFLQALLSERGAKGMVEMLRMIDTASETTGKNLGNVLANLQENITNSYGFAAINAAKMSQTADNQFKALKATLGTSMNEAYREMEPDLLLIADAFKRVFGSPEFVQGLSSMIEGIARLGLAITENVGAIKIAAIAYTALKVTQLASAAALDALAAGKSLYTAATVRSTVAIEAETAAEVAGTAARAGKAAGLLGLARFIPGLNLVVGLGTTAWIAYDWYATSHKQSKQSYQGPLQGSGPV